MLSTAVAAKPNIVVIMADDLGWKDLHCYGNAQIDTPYLDRLAEEGMRFTGAYAAAPVCSPTRGAMMTGLAPARLRLTNHAPGHPDGFSLKGSNLQEAESVRHLELSYITIAERLKETGYATAHIGKWHLSYVARNDRSGIAEADLRPEKQGFERNVGGWHRGGPASYFSPYKNKVLPDGKEGEYLPERLAEEAIAFVTESREGPFFLNWWPYSVHYPFQAPEPTIEKYRARKGIKNATYAAMIEGMDRAIGRFLAALDDAGLRENTLVIFNSDNGGYNGDNRPLRGFKGMIFEGGIRVPWIVRWPGVVEAGTTCTTPVISMDCYPTILEAAGIEEGPGTILDGESIFPLLKQTGGLEREAIFFHYPNYAFHKKNRLASAIRSGNHKLVRRYDDGSIELYNLAEDIGEEHNLVTRFPELAKQLDEKLKKWLREVNACLPTRGKPGEKRNGLLKAVGGKGGGSPKAANGRLSRAVTRDRVVEIIAASSGGKQ
jgi:arylsulfatase A-like enzyme